MKMNNGITELVYSLEEISARVRDLDFPFTGITELGSAYFKFLEPSYFAGAAIHAGSQVRPDLLELMQVSQSDRYREEDPGTERFIADFPIQIIARDSRFEYDLNRQLEQVIYKTPEMAWGLTVWKRPLTDAQVSASLAKYHEFHALIDIVVTHLLSQNAYAALFDCHSYNYQREQRVPWYEDKKPVINIGTLKVNRDIFGDVVESLMERCGQIHLEGRKVYVAENEVFRGGHMANRLNLAHQDRLFVPAIEFKKVFMDEWQGTFNEPVFMDLIRQFQASVMEIRQHPRFTAE